MKMKERIQKEVEALTMENRTLKTENQSLQQRTKALQNENDSLHQQLQSESAAFAVDSWKVSRDHLSQDQKFIGGGAWGVVVESKLCVAVKRIYPEILSPQNVTRLKREMKMLTRIRHPNLVQLIGVVFEDGDNYFDNPPCIITELLETNLRKAYQQKQITKETMCPIFQDVARALDYLHRRYEPIVHRDVSSANVLLKPLPNRRWMAKVSDLGSANLAKEAFTKNEGAVIYSAPEAFTDRDDTQSEETLTAKVDVYSYGIMLCEVATSRLPEKKIFCSMLDQVKHNWPNLHHLITICIEQDPEKRPSMEEVLATLLEL